MNSERPNEADAKKIVERIMRVGLVHADTHGGVDYLSPDGTVALEVTAVTDGARRGARRALRKSEEQGATKELLQSCWIVFAADTQPGMKTFVQRVHPLIAELELAGETSFDDQRGALHVIQQRELSHIYLPLLEAGVERALFAPHEPNSDDPDHLHRIFVSTGSGGTANGSEDALERLLAALSEKDDNSRKLAASGAEQRHLFVWIDDDTPFNIARPLSHESPNWAATGWGLPTSGPALDPAVTHLWVLHERSRLGWLWDGLNWRELRGV